MSKCIWIAGGSSGIGLELVKLWLLNGDRLIVSARQACSTAMLQAIEEV